MGLFDFLKGNKNKQVDNNSNTTDGELSEEVLEKVNNYGSEGFKEELKNSEEPKNSNPKEWMHDANWRRNSRSESESDSYILYRFDKVLQGGDVYKEYVKPSDMGKVKPKRELYTLDDEKIEDEHKTR